LELGEPQLELELELEQQPERELVPVPPGGQHGGDGGDDDDGGAKRRAQEPFRVVVQQLEPALELVQSQLVPVGVVVGLRWLGLRLVPQWLVLEPRWLVL
jgi:hypothetical protein